MQQAPFEDVTFTSGRLSFRIAPLSGLRLTFPEAGDTLSGTLATVDGTQPRFDRVALQRIGPITLADTMPPVRSIRILKLREELERNPDALNEFWTSVKRSGAPLVEPDPGDERFQYATFLWQGLSEHKNVVIIWMLPNHPIALPRTAPVPLALRALSGSRNPYRRIHFGLVVAGLEKVGNELVKYRSAIHVHTRMITPLTVSINY